MYHILAILTVCLWGTTFVSTKVLLMEGLSPSTIFFLRFLLAYAGMAAVCRKRLFTGSWRDEFLMFVAGLTGGSLYFVSENTALEYALAGNVSLVVCLAPLLTILYDGVVHRNFRSFSARMLSGSLLAFVGVSLIVGAEPSTAAASRPFLGGVLAFVAAALWAVYQLIVKPLGDRYGALMLTRKVFGYGLLSLLFFQMSGHSVLPSDMEVLLRPAVWGNLLYLGIVASWICYFVWNKVVAKLGSVVSANYIYLNPLTTCLFSYVFLDERLSALMVFGGAAILAGIYLAAGAPAGGLSRKRKKCFPSS